MDVQVPNRGPELMAVDVCFAVMAFIACVLRVFTRLYMVKAFGADDVLMVVSTVSTAPFHGRVNLLGLPREITQSSDANV